MRDAPETRDLIETAREALKAEILPGLSGEAKYAGAMIANALGIALRDLDAASDTAGDAEAEARALRDLLEEAGGALADLNAAFARAIRAGRLDPGTQGHAAARRILWSQSVERLARVNPRQLGAERQAGTLPETFTPWQEED